MVLPLMVDDLYSMDLNLLVIFAALMRERNVTRCAQRLRVGQPSISSSLGRLRTLFNDPLFVRAGQGVQPTAKAIELLHLIGPALDLIEASVRGRDDFTPAACHECFYIGVGSGVTVALVTDILTSILKEAPGAIISVGQYDLGIPANSSEFGSLAIGYFPKIRGFAIENLGRCRTVLVRSRESAKVLSITDFVGRPHVIVPYGPGAQKLLDSKLQQAGVSRRSVVHLPNTDGVGRLVIGTDTVAVISDLDGRLLEGDKRLAIDRLPPPLEQEFDLSMIWPESKNLQPAEVWFRTQVRGRLGQVGPFRASSQVT